MDPIKVKKPPKSAFNPNRPASDLLKNQVEHLEWAVRNAGERRLIGGVVKARTGSRIKPVRTEADASKRMSALIPKLESAANLSFGETALRDAEPLVAAKKAPRRKTASRGAKRRSKPLKRTGAKRPAAKRKTARRKTAKRKTAKRKSARRTVKRAKR